MAKKIKQSSQQEPHAKVRFPIKLKIALSFLVVLIFVIVLDVVVQRNLDSTREQFSYVIENDTKVISNAEKLRKLVVDMETGQRGFIITGDENFLEPYKIAVKLFADVMKEEMRAVEDNPLQVATLVIIDNLVSQWQDYAANTIVMSREISKGNVELEDLQDLLRFKVGKTIRGELRSVLQTMQSDFEKEGSTRGSLAIESIGKSLVDLETGQRGFIITGVDDFLYPYNMSKIHINEKISKLKDLIENTHDRSFIDENINRLKSLEKKWLTAAGEHEINFHRKAGLSKHEHIDDQELLLDETGKKIVDEIYKTIDQMLYSFETSQNEKGGILLYKIMKSMVNMETGQRGYTFTGEESFFVQLVDGRKSFTESILLLEQLNSNSYDIVEMKNNIEELELLTKKWIKDAGEVGIAARREMNKNPETFRDIANALRKGTGKRISDQIRDKFQEFIDKEIELSEQRYQNVLVTTKNTSVRSHLLTIVAVFASGVAGFLLIRGIMNPLHLLVNKAKAVGKGNYETGNKLVFKDEYNLLADAFESMTSEVKKAHNVLESEKATLKKVNLELDSFVYMASHDLRAPLRGISSFSSIIQKQYSDKLGDDGKEYLTRIAKGTAHLSDLINDLLTLSRISRLEAPYKETDIGDVIDDILTRIKFDIDETKAGIIVQSPMPTVSCVETKIGEVFLNLINNAIKFSSRNNKVKPKIDIGYKSLEHEHEFVVTDNGIGIDPEYHDQVFGIFNQLNKAGEYEGTGVGLSIVKRVIDSHGGRVWITSELGRGTSFYFTIPKGLA